MPIDPYIALQGKTATPVTALLQGRAAQQQYESGQQDLAKGDIELQNLRQAQTDKAGIRQVLGQHAQTDINTPEGRAAFLGDLGKVAPEHAFKLRHELAAEDAQQQGLAIKARKEAIETQKAELMQHRETLGLVGDVIGSGQVKDQASYDRALTILAPIIRKAGFDLSGVPRQYDPQVVKQFAELNRTSQQRTEEGLKQLDIESRTRLAEATMNLTAETARAQREATATQGQLQREATASEGRLSRQSQAAMQIEGERARAAESGLAREATAALQREGQANRQSEAAIGREHTAAMQRSAAQTRTEEKRVDEAQDKATKATAVLRTTAEIKDLMNQGVRESGIIDRAEQLAYEKTGAYNDSKGNPGVGERTQRLMALGDQLVTQSTSLAQGVTDKDAAMIKNAQGAFQTAKTNKARQLALNSLVNAANTAIGNANTLLGAQAKGERLPGFTQKKVATKADIDAMVKATGASRAEVIKAFAAEGAHTEE